MTITLFVKPDDTECNCKSYFLRQNKAKEKLLSTEFNGLQSKKVLQIGQKIKLFILKRAQSLTQLILFN